MRRFMLVALALGFIVPFFASAPAQAQATRTWVSGVGDDANPCSRTAPCKTFPGAISKTAAGGEINCLDPGGFGAVTIIKAMTISCEVGTAGVLVAGTNAIVVSAGANDNVVLRGLDIQGVGTGLSGVVFNSGRSLIIENCLISGFNAGSASGILAQPSTIATMNVKNSLITNNGTASSGGGILAAAGSGGFLRLVLTNTTIDRNLFFGVSAAATAATTQVEVYNSVISNNASNGLNATGTGAIKVGSSIITGNASVATNGNVSSFGNNQIIDNATDNTPPSAGTLK